MAECRLSSYEEFLASFKYFFFLFQKPFPAELEHAAQAQWRNLKDGDALVTEDGQNNPLVDLKLDPAFGKALCAALADRVTGELPALAVPHIEEQVAFWREKASRTMFPQAVQELSETRSHWETVQDAIAGYASPSGGVVAPGAPLKIVVLGASERYEYTLGLSGVDDLMERLSEVVEAVAPGRQADFVLCGRDVPQSLTGTTTVSKSGRVTARHCASYLHDLPGVTESLRGALLVALHSGMGLDHPELTASWPPTFNLLRAATPCCLAVSSFNLVEHEAAERALRTSLLTQLSVQFSGVNRAGSLQGPETIGPFDGIQGKRNYALLRATVIEPPPKMGDGWDLFN